MYRKLEALRGLAACMVVLHHTQSAVFAEPLPLVANAYLFVDLFFVLSGFVLSFAYGDRIASGFSLSRFAALRLGRIYPLHLFMLLVFVVYAFGKWYLIWSTTGVERTMGADNGYSLLMNILLLHSMGTLDQLTWNYPSWSISVEFFAYLTFFLLLRTLDRSRGLILPLVVAAASYGVLLALGHPTLDITYDFGFVRCVGAFYLGVWLFRVSLGRKSMIRSHGLTEVATVAVLIALVSVAHVSIWFQLMAVLSFVWAVYVFSSDADGWIGQLFGGRLMQRIGLWSYSIYMTHAFVITVVLSFGRWVFDYELRAVQGPAAFLINSGLLVITIVISRFTYVHIEDRCRRLVKARLTRSADLPVIQQ